MILKEIQNAGIIPSYLNEELFRSISHTFVINRVPHGHSLIKKGETPKVIFLIIKGMVKKVVDIEKESNQELNRSMNHRLEIDSYSVSHYSAGDYFPKANLNTPVNYNLVTECPS